MIGAPGGTAQPGRGCGSRVDHDILYGSQHCGCAYPVDPMLHGSYWLEEASLPQSPPGPLPGQVDVLIVGAGYTGLSAARETVRAGLSTLVLDRGDIGGGCSGLNGGQVAHSIKPSYEELSGRHGADVAFRIGVEARAAVENLRTLATREGLDCDWRGNGGFYAARTPRHFRMLVKDATSQTAGLEQRISVVEPKDVGRELESDRYHGGLVYHDDASIQPTKLVCALHARATAAGATVHGHCAVTGIERTGAGFSVRTERGIVRARRVLIATNGYTGPLSPWHQRRVIPIGSYQIATEELGTERVRQLIPNGRNVSDSRRVIIYLRPSPDGRRILFGGRAALSETDATRCVPKLLEMLTSVFPSLAGVRATHAWTGFIAYTFDTLPHLGQQDGLYYCMGYCGQGVPSATYYGTRIGQQIAGLAEGRTALDGLAFPTRPLYSGRPWFLVPTILAYRALDAIGW